MAEGEFRTLLTSVIIVCLFAYLLIMASIGLAGEYGKDTSELNSESLNFTGINSTLSSAESTANNWKEAFSGQKGVIGQANIILIGLFDLGKTMFGVMISPIYLILFIFQNVLGLPAVVSGVIVFLIIVAFIFSLWRLIKVADT